MKHKILFIFMVFLMSAQAQQNIIGGQNTTIADNPWQISMRATNNHHIIGIRNEHICGGAILTSEWIITAAHCVTNFTTNEIMGVNEITISAGITLRNDAISGQYKNVAQIIRHPNYNPVTYENDVALIKLTTPLNFTTTVAPIQFIDHASQTAVGIEGRVTGWGNTLVGTASTPANQLQTLEIPIISRMLANNLNTGSVNVSNKMIPLYEYGNGVSRGDSGGPLSIVMDGIRYLIGVSSWGEIPKDQKPTIYSNLLIYREWVAENIPLPSLIGPNGVCENSYSTYTLNNLPFNVTWNTSGNLTITNSNNSSITVQPSPNFNETDGLITATFSNGGKIKKAVKIGSPTITAENYSYNNSTNYSISPYYSIPNNAVTEVPAYVEADFSFEGATSSNVQILGRSDYSISWNVAPGSDQLLLNFDFYQSDQWIIFQISAISPCGTSTYDVAFYSPTSSGGYLLYPNPADTELIVAYTEVKNETEKMAQSIASEENPKAFEILLTDLNGNKLISAKSKEGKKQLRLNTQNIPEGIYFLQINDNNSSVVKKVIISH